MNFIDDEGEPDTPVAPRSRELAVEVLKLLTASLAFAAAVVGLVSKYPWFSKPWILDGVIALGFLILAWFAKPRFIHWFQRIKRRKREQQLISTNDVCLREFVEQFAEFISDNNTRSLRYIVRSSCFREQLMFPVQSLGQFLGRCREFTNLVQQFNSNYALR